MCLAQGAFGADSGRQLTRKMPRILLTAYIHILEHFIHDQTLYRLNNNDIGNIKNYDIDNINDYIIKNDVEIIKDPMDTTSEVEDMDTSSDEEEPVAKRQRTK